MVELVTDDMPFLVDSVTGALSARNLDVQLLVHPVVVVRRCPTASFFEICADVEPDDAIPDDIVESWMRLEIDPVRDVADQRVSCKRIFGGCWRTCAARSPTGPRCAPAH